MTAIAYRNGVIAADTNACVDDIVVGQVHKIRKQNNILAGAAGTSVACERFFEEFAKNNATGFRIDGEAAKDFEAIVIADKTLWYVSSDGSHTIQAPFFALGAARGILIGAMAAGASAEEAVRIAIQYDCLCGGKVESYALETVK